jgi:hypothetical protein
VESRQSGYTLNVELGVDSVDEQEVKVKILKHFKILFECESQKDLLIVSVWKIWCLLIGTSKLHHFNDSYREKNLYYKSKLSCSGNSLSFDDI